MIAAILALFGTGAGRIVGYVLLAASVVAGGAWLLHEHDQQVIAAVRASQAQAVAAAAAQDTQRVNAAVDAIQAAATARIASMAAIRRTVDAAPQSSTCASSVAVRAALDGLRQRAGGSRGAPAASP